MLALVTGASSGIGRAAALRLATDGYDVVVHYGRNDASAREVAAAIEQRGRRATLWQFDLGHAERLESALDELRDRLGEVPSVLVNNAGVTADTPLVLMDWDAFDKVLKVNLYAPYASCRWLLRNHPRKHKASIINIGSVSAQVGNVAQANYAASKAGLVALTKVVAKEGARKNVRANALAVGVVATPMTEGVKALDGIAEHIPLRRIGQPDEIAAAIAFLASDESSYITGQTLSVNGGLYCDG